MKKITCSFLAVCVLSLVLQSGCASIVNGRSQDIQLRSEPSSAVVTIDGMKMGSTPMILDLKRKKRHTIQFSKENHESITRGTGRSFNWWFMGNLLFGGIIGMIIDLANGAAYKINPDVIFVELPSSSGAETPVQAATLASSSEVSSIEQPVLSSQSSGKRVIFKELEKLDEMRSNGLMTQEEYESKRKDLLHSSNTQ